MFTDQETSASMQVLIKRKEASKGGKETNSLR